MRGWFHEDFGLRVSCLAFFSQPADSYENDILALLTVRSLWGD